MFILGLEQEKQALKASKALILHSKQATKDHTAIYVIIDLKTPVVRTKDYIPRVIPVSKKLAQLDEQSVLLITKDPLTPYRKALTEKNSPTEDVFNHIYTLTKVKSIAKDPAKIKRLFKDHDMVVADNRVHKFLPGILGPQFYVKNKKIPYMVQMAKPSPTAVLVKGKLGKLKDERCEPEYVLKQMKLLVRNASFVPSSSGTCISIKVGYTSWSAQEIVQNVGDVLSYLIDIKYQPVGGLLKGMKNVKCVHLKTSESASMPVYREVVEESEGEDDSELDFE